MGLFAYFVVPKLEDIRPAINISEILEDLEVLEKKLKEREMLLTKIERQKRINDPNSRTCIEEVINEDIPHIIRR